MKKILYIFLTLLSVQVSAQIEQPRIKFDQVIKDSTGSGRIVISSLDDSSMIYSPDFFINTADSLLILFGDTVQAGSAVDAAQVRDIIYATIDAGLGIEIDTSSQIGILTIQSLSIEDSVYNSTGVEILKGTPLYVTGIQGNYWSVEPAQANDPTKMPVVAIAGENIAAGQQGLGLLKGHIKGVNTETFTAGDEVWVGATGGYTNVRPKGEGVLVQKLGTVVKADINGSGIINLGEVQYNLNPNNIFIGGADSLQTTANLPTVLSDSLNNYVTIAGTETITGAKTFTSDLNIDAKIALNDGGNSVFIGDGAGRVDDGVDNRNVGVGYQALYSNTTGGNNIANGYQALYNNTIGSSNVANGSLALYNNISGNGNIANGSSALYSDTSGSSNIANGAFALYSNTSGNNNVANGAFALYSNTIGYQNVANGRDALYSLSSGNNNQAYGYQAGRYYGSGSDSLTTANGSIFIGSNTRASANGNENEIVIGTNAIGNGNNSVTIGASTNTKTILNGIVGIGTNSPNSNYKLHVEGISYLSGGIQMNSGDEIDFGNSNQYITAVNNTSLTLATGGSATLTATHAGNVGIGTTSPATKLEVVGGVTTVRKSGIATPHSDTDLLVTDATAPGSTALIEILGGNAGYSMLKFADTDYYSAGSIDYYHVTNSMNFRTNNAIQATISSTGNVGIGTSSPAQKLDVAGHVLINTPSGGSQSGYALKLNKTNSSSQVQLGAELLASPYSTNTNGGNLIFKTVNSSAVSTTAMVIDGAQNVGIGTTNPSEKLNVVGNVEVDGKIALNDGNDNVVIGDGAGASLVSGQALGNVLIGTDAGAVIDSGDYNVANGYRALYSNTIGNRNTANGYQALRSNTTGNYNSAYGYQALYANTTGDKNIANGYETLRFNETGDNNIANGYAALFYNKTGSSNVANGYQALFSLSSGSNNQAYGYEAGRYLSNGSTALDTANGSLFLGSYTKALANNDTNEIVIGTNAIGNGSNTITIGSSSAVSLHTGNYEFDINQTVDGTKDNYVLTYDSLDGQISLEPRVESAAFQQEFTAVANDSSYSVTTASLPIDINNVLVFQNGQVLDKTMFTKSGDTINLNFQPEVGDKIVVMWFKGDIVDIGGNYVTLDQTETITGAKTFTNTFTQSNGDANFDSGTLFVDEDTDRVGIGTTSPVAKFEVADGSSSITLREYSNGAAILLDGVDGDFTGGDYYHILADGNSYLGLGGYAGGITPLNINSLGNVGIGTTNPSAALHVYDTSSGEVKFQRATGYSGLLHFGFPSGLPSIRTSGNFAIKASDTWGADFYIASTGNVGIGTTSPGHKLHVVGGNIFGSSNVLANNNVYAAGLNGFVFGSSTSEGEYIYRSGNDIRIHAASLDRLSVLGSGNVGIGTTSPTDRLEVSGSTFNRASFIATANVQTGIKIERTGGVSDTSWEIYSPTSSTDLRIYNSSDRVTFTSNGNVGIGTTSPAFTLDVNGKIRVGTVTSQSPATLISRRNGANIEFGHGNTSSGYYGTIGVQGNNGQPYFALSAECESNVNTFTTRGFKGNVITTDGNGSLMFTQLTSANATGQSLTERMRIDASGKVGIGTTSPSSKLEVNGSATNSSANNESSDATIDFSLSNIAYTGSLSGTITLTNIKDGGAYTLISTATNLTSKLSFTLPTGLEFVDMGTVPRTNGKKHIYSIIVAGGFVYVTMATQN